MASDLEEDILCLYEDIKGIKFKGIYHGEDDKFGTIRYLVEVDDFEMISLLKKIYNKDCPPGDKVWKGITVGYTDDVTKLWVYDINGDPVEGESYHFMIIKVESVTINIRLYDRLINVFLKVVD